MSVVKIVLIEDDPRYRSSLETLIAHAPGFAVAASFDGVATAVAAAEELRFDGRPWDVALLDIDLGERLSGIDAVPLLKAILPELRIIMITVFEEPATILRAICAGADGYLLKKASAREILQQLRAVTQGGAPMTPGVARTVLDLVRKLAPDELGPSAPARLNLTEREREVLRALVGGMTYKEAASALDIRLDTVRSHIRGLYKKLHVHSAAEAVTRALRDGLV